MGAHEGAIPSLLTSSLLANHFLQYQPQGMSNQSSSSRSAGGDHKMRDASPYQEPSTSKSSQKSSKSVSEQPPQSYQSQPSSRKKSKSAGKQQGTVDNEPFNKASSKSAGKAPAAVEDETSVDESIYGYQEIGRASCRERVF